MSTILENERKDWLYIILSPIAGFLLVGIYWLLTILIPTNQLFATTITFVVYTVFFDIRHLFSTYARTYLDSSYLKENKRWLHVSFAFLILVPFAVFGLFSQSENGWYQSGVLLTYMLRFTSVLGLYHLVKQNWGFMAIYKKKMNEPMDSVDKWEKWMLLSGSFLPLIIISIVYSHWFPHEVYFIAPTDPNWSAIVLKTWSELSFYSLIVGVFLAAVGWMKNTRVQFKYVARNLGVLFFGIFVLIQSLLKNGNGILYVLLYVVILLFIISSIIVFKNTQKQKNINTKKWAVMLTSFILYWGIILLPIENKLIIVIAITLPHNIQYLKFVNVFSKKYYSSSQKNHGLARLMVEKVSLFVALSFVYAIVYEVLRTGSKFITFTSNEQHLYMLQNGIAIFFMLMSLHHYYLDAVIWRVRKDDAIKTSV
jgi:hypothetical protein